MKRFAFAVLSLLVIMSFIVTGCAEKVNDGRGQGRRDPDRGS